MTGFLNSLKADLLDRRLLPLVALVTVALVAAVAYAAFGGGSSSATPTASVLPSVPVTASAGIAVSQKTPENAVAEMAGATSVQHRGSARNPFAPLPGTKAASATNSSTSTASPSPSASSTPAASAPSSSTPSATTPSTPAAPSTPAKPAKPAKPKTVYHVAVLFGALPEAGSAAKLELTPYEDLKLLTPLPSAAQALLVFRGVTAGGKSATFTVVGEVILHGQAECLPSATQCEAIDLAPGKVEDLEYLSPSGQLITYELTVVSIASAKASGASVKSALRGESKAGRALLRDDGLESIPYLHDSSQVGVLVFASRPAFGAHAHAAARRRHSH
jgi:cell division septation protein DedD